MDFSSFIFLFSLFISVFMLSKIILPTISKTKSKSIAKLPPGPRKIPFIGNLHILASSRPPQHTLKDLALKYGPLMHLQLGEKSTLVVSSPEMAKEIYKTHDVNFSNKPNTLIGEVIGYKSTDIVFSPYGEYWRQLRKLCTFELLSMRRVQSFRPVREEEYLNLCRWIASKEGSAVNLTEKIEFTTYDVVTSASLGKKIGEKAKFISLVHKFILKFAGLHVSDMFPSIKILHLIDLFRAERLHREIDQIIEKIIREYMSNLNTYDSGSTKQEDLLDVLLKCHVDAGGEQSLTTDNVKAILADVFNAGTHTSAGTVEWAMSELLKNPSSLKKAQEEVSQVYDEQGYVDESFVHELKYLKLVIKETLRLHPPGALLPARENKEPCVIGGYEIPSGTQVLVNAWALGRDPKYWNEAESFIPERFLDTSLDFKGNNYEYLPFGSGRRVCPGMTFGLANVELPLAMLLYHFDWVLHHGMKPEELPMTESAGAINRRKDPLHVTPIVRRPLPCE